MREVDLGSSIRGHVFLHSMPGRWESFDEFLGKLAHEPVTLIVSLASRDEIKRKSQSYYAAITSGTLPIPLQEFAIEDFSAPSDFAAFRDFVLAICDRVVAGDCVLVHCGAGIGRTGMFTQCLLMALGFSREEAEERVAAAGSRPEAQEQESLVEWFSTQA